MQIIKIIAFGTIGFFLGIGILYIHGAGFFESCQKQVSPYDDIAEYFSGTNNQDSSTEDRITNQCDYSFPEFSFISNHPTKIVDCAQITTLYPEAIGRKTLVRDANGAIWEWSYIGYLGLDEIACWPSLGIFFGVVVAISTKKSVQASPSIQ